MSLAVQFIAGNLQDVAAPTKCCHFRLLAGIRDPQYIHDGQCGTLVLKSLQCLNNVSH